MNNIIILGTGRSGTSMTAGLFSGGVYFMGDNINKPNETNPKGQFEDSKVNQLNEEILANVVNSRPEGWLGRTFFRNRPASSQRWLSILQKPMDSINLTTEQIESIKYYTSKKPFCYKDPRFSYTLPVWMPYLNETKYLIIFRHPLITIESMMRQRLKVSHLKDFQFDNKYLFKVWYAMYNHIIKVILPVLRNEDFLIMHYNQLFDSIKLDEIDKIAQFKIDRTFPDTKLVKASSYTDEIIPSKVKELYSWLCKYSHYEE